MEDSYTGHHAGASESTDIKVQNICHGKSAISCNHRIPGTL